MALQSCGHRLLLALYRRVFRTSEAAEGVSAASLRKMLLLDEDAALRRRRLRRYMLMLQLLFSLHRLQTAPIRIPRHRAPPWWPNVAKYMHGREFQYHFRVTRPLFDPLAYSLARRVSLGVEEGPIAEGTASMDGPSEELAVVMWRPETPSEQ